MKSFLDALEEDTQEKLGRQLQKREIKFLHWVYDRYKEEQQKDNVCIS